MKNILLVFCLLAAGTGFVRAGGLTLASHGKSGYVIIIPEKATPVEKKAADEFRRLFALSSSVELPVCTDARRPSAREIVIGNTSRSNSAADTSGLQQDGFVIRTDRKSLSIRGGSEKGVLYGVYTFFDKYLGYRCYSPTVFKYPTLAKVTVAAGIADRQVPVNLYRNVFYEVADDPFYADWHKLDHMKPDWGMWVHTFAQLLPPDRYFAEHEEC